MHAPIPYELRIGLTGDRTIADAPAASRTVHALLDRIERTFSGPMTPLIWTIRSSRSRTGPVVNEAEIEHQTRCHDEEQKNDKDMLH
jgi:hypothetical protein